MSENLYIAGEINPTEAVFEAFDSFESFESPLGRIALQMSDDFEEDCANIEISLDILKNNVRSRHLDPKYRTAAKIASISLALAGTINDLKTGTNYSGGLEHWRGRPITTKLHDYFKCHVTVTGDTEAAAMAEVRLGKGMAYPFLYVHWADGINVSPVTRSDGKQYAHASELGHISFDPLANEINDIPFQEKEGRPPICGCGKFGCLESLYGIAALTSLEMSLEELPASHLKAAIDDIAKMIDFAILSLQPTDRVIIGGKMIDAHPELVDQIGERLREIRTTPKVPLVLSSTFGDRTTIVGALALTEGVKNNTLIL